MIPGRRHQLGANSRFIWMRGAGVAGLQSWREQIFAGA